MKLIITESEKNQIKSLYNLIFETTNLDVISVNPQGKMVYDGKIYQFYRYKKILMAEKWIPVHVDEFKPVNDGWVLKGHAYNVTAEKKIDKKTVDDIKMSLKSGNSTYQGEYDGMIFKLVKV